MRISYGRDWRRDVPMLDEQEYARVCQVYMNCVEAVKRYRQEHNATLSATPLDDLYLPATELVAAITGTAEFSLDEVVRRHRLARWQRPLTDTEPTSE